MTESKYWSLKPSNLFITFITLYMVMNTLNYFSFMYENKTSKHSPKPKTNNWKW